MIKLFGGTTAEDKSSQGTGTRQGSHEDDPGEGGCGFDCSPGSIGRYDVQRGYVRLRSDDTHPHATSGKWRDSAWPFGSDGPNVPTVAFVPTNGVLLLGPDPL